MLAASLFFVNFSLPTIGQLTLLSQLLFAFTGRNSFISV